MRHFSNDPAYGEYLWQTKALPVQVMVAEYKYKALPVQVMVAEYKYKALPVQVMVAEYKYKALPVQVMVAEYKALPVQVMVAEYKYKYIPLGTSTIWIHFNVWVHRGGLLAYMHACIIQEEFSQWT